MRGSCDAKRRPLLLGGLQTESLPPSESARPAFPPGPALPPRRMECPRGDRAASLPARRTGGEPTSHASADGQYVTLRRRKMERSVAAIGVGNRLRLCGVTLKGAVMSPLRAQHWLLLVTAMVALCVPISAADYQQRLPPGLFGIFGAIINSAIVDFARREWQNRPVADYNCLHNNNVSADQLAASGIGPNDPRIRRLFYECAHARTSPRIEPKLDTTLTIVPYHPNFEVDGLALGGDVYPDSAVYQSYTCHPSVDFAGFIWCSAHHPAMDNFGRPYNSLVLILHSNANKVAFITQTITPAFFQAGDVDREIRRLSRGFGQAQILIADPRPGVLHAVLAAWGAVTLTPLDETAMDALRRGEPIHRGLIAEFIGDAHKSARIGLPVYSIGGGPGYLWGASFDNAGKGSLRISAVDASALSPTQLAPPGPGAPSPSTPSPSTPPSEESQTQTPTPPPSQPPPQPPPAAPPPKTMDVIDFLVDWKSLIGQTVTVTGCSLIEADTSGVECSAGPQGLFAIDSNTLAREDFRRALRECAGFKQGDECLADVTGNVTENSIGDVKLTDAAMNWAATLAAPESPQSPQSPPRAENHSPGAMPTAEKAVIDAVEQARHDYASASNEMQEGAARPTRAKNICAAIPDRYARRWVGNVSTVSSNSEGKGVLSIEIAPGVQIETMNNSFSDMSDHTLIDPSTSLYQQAQSLNVGQAVRFSGMFVRSSVDCIEEISLTLHGSVSEPGFIIRFSEVSPLT